MTDIELTMITKIFFGKMVVTRYGQKPTVQTIFMYLFVAFDLLGDGLCYLNWQRLICWRTHLKSEYFRN